MFNIIITAIVHIAVLFLVGLFSLTLSFLLAYLGDPQLAKLFLAKLKK